MPSTRHGLSLVLLLISLPVQAAFNVKKYKAPEQNYGQGQTQTYSRALKGGEPIRPDEQRDINGLLPETDQDRYYGRAASNIGNVGVSHVSNQSQGSYAGSPNQKKRYASQSGIELAFGYSWTHWRAEAELLINRNFNYNASFTNNSHGQNLNSQISNTTFFLNTYHDFEGIGFLKPYLMGGLGYGFNGANSLLSQNGQSLGSQNFRGHGLAVNVGLGLRYRLLKKWDVHVGYRYAVLGPVRWHVDPNFKLLGLTRSNSLSLGMLYHF